MSSIIRGKKFGTQPHHQGDKDGGTSTIIRGMKLGTCPPIIRALGAVGQPKEVALGGMSPMSLTDPSWT